MSISLSKGSRISLEKRDGSNLTNIAMGLGWDPAKSGGGLFGRFGGGGSVTNIDLDASCIAFDANKKIVDTVWFRNKSTFSGAITHSGDNLTGEGEGDDETILLRLERVPQNVQSIVFTINSYQGQKFDKISRAYCRVIDTSNNNEVAKYDITELGHYTGMIVASIYRNGDKWKVRAIGELANGRVVGDIAHIAAQYA